MEPLPLDPYRVHYYSGIWTKKNGDMIHISDMTKSHLKNTIALCKRAAEASLFKCDKQKWMAWHEVLCHEYNSRFIKGE